MLNVTIICVGKLKEQYLRDACSEYSKRLSSSCKLNIVEVNEEKTGNNPSGKEIENVLAAEGRRIIEKIPKGSDVYSMCIEGRQRTSEELSHEIESLGVSGVSSLVFIIGGSFGLSDEVKKISEQKLSMSRMTFPHQLARVMLLEQIYRAMQISLGTKYHK